MKKTLAALLLISSLNSFAGIVPRINCIGSIYDKESLTTEEVQEEKVLLEYRSGGAAFSNVFFGELQDLTFIVIINKMFPISNLEAVPVSMGIYEAKEGSTLVEKPALLLANGMSTKVEVSSKKKIFTLTCSRIANP